MKVVILAGGFGSRISEESAVRPKPLVEIGGQPILWHIMKNYSAFGLTEFVICCGYKGYMIKDYILNYYLHTCDVTFDMRTNSIQWHRNGSEPWQVTMVDTGDATMTGGRMKRVREHLGNETFCCTYGDGVSNVDIRALIDFHRREGVLATLTAVQPPGRFGTFSLGENEHRVPSFNEKPKGDGAWVNGGFFVIEPAALDYIEGDATTWEREPMERLAHDGQLGAFKHQGFWHPMDTLRDRNVLEDLWQSGAAPWRRW
jgi:glucose-1-phosphate cytidylyltransferase